MLGDAEAAGRSQRVEPLLAASGVLTPEFASEGSSSSSSGPAAALEAPKGFKAVKRRKSAYFIEAFVDEQNSGETNEPARCPSEVNPRLIDGTERGNVTAGLARLVYRYMTEGEEEDRRSAFDEDLFFIRADQRACRSCRFWCCKPRQRRPDTPDSIFDLLQNICGAGYFQKELLVLCTIYLERLLQNPDISLSPRNWQPILITTVLLASKVWEDIHPWNIDFAITLRRAVDLELHSIIDLYALESLFLKHIDWDVCVSGEEYGQYLLALRGGDESVPVRAFPDQQTARRLRTTSWGEAESSSRRLDDSLAVLDTLYEVAAEGSARSIGGSSAEGDSPEESRSRRSSSMSSGFCEVEQSSTGSWTVRQASHDTLWDQSTSASSGLSTLSMKRGSKAAKSCGSILCEAGGDLPSVLEEDESTSSMTMAMGNAKSRSSGSLQQDAAAQPASRLSAGGLRRTSKGSAQDSAQPAGGGLRRSSGSSGQLCQDASKSMLASGMRRSSRSSGFLAEEAQQAMAVAGLRRAGSFQETPGMIRRRSFGRLVEEKAPHAVKRQSDPELAKALVDKGNWLDRGNPYVGLFRHALPASPPSRHIGQKRSINKSMRISMSCSNLAAYGDECQGGRGLLGSPRPFQGGLQ